MNNKLIFPIIILVALLIIPNVLAESNESIQASKVITQAKADFEFMISRNMPLTRANESLREALQLFEAQTALEEKGRNPNYALVIDYASKVSSLKDIATKAQDELKIFDDSYLLAQKDINLSSMQKEYDEIHRSFNDSRFEDTLTLIDEGYQTLSEVQSSQTTLRIFYDATSRSIAGFFIQNWLEIVIAVVVFAIILLFSWKTLKRVRIKLKIYNLVTQKSSLTSLIKKLQEAYFTKKTISETEYKVKTERFKEMIRDVDRQIPLLKEGLMKLHTKANTLVKENPQRKKK